MQYLIRYISVSVLALAMGRETCRAEALASRISQSPFFFEQAPSGADCQYFSRGPHYAFEIAGDHAEIVLLKANSQKIEDMPGRGVTDYADVSIRKLRLDFSEANPNALVSGGAGLPGKVNYFIGSDPAQWRTASMYSQVRVSEVYPGISMVYYGNGRQFEYDFELQPGADPHQISIRITGADGLRVDAQGDLVIDLAGEQIRQAPPQIFQFVNGMKQPVSGRYHVEGGNVVRIEVDKYNPGIPLTIDPQLIYSSYFGGNFGDRAYAIKVDPSGNVYIAGQTLSKSFLFTTNTNPELLPTNTIAITNSGGKINGDAFVARLSTDPDSPPAYFTYLGGNGNDGANDLVVDGSRYAYITGFTGSPDFPTWPTNFFTAAFNGLSNNIAGSFDTKAHVFATDVFVTELDTQADGTNSLVFSACFGGTRADVGVGIALNGTGEIFLTGYTDSTNFPVTASGFQTNGIDTVTNVVHGVMKTNYYRRTNDVFIVKLAPSEDILTSTAGILYSSYLGGTNKDVGQGIAAFEELAFVTGYTASTNFPITTNNAWTLQINGSTNAAKQYFKKAVPLDAFIAEFDTSLSGAASLPFCSYYGGSNSDAGYRIVVDTNKQVYITGNTSSRDFPRLNANSVAIGYGLDPTNVLNYDAILAKFDFTDELNPVPVWSFSFGGKSDDVGWGLALDPDGGIYVVGTTISSKTNFPTSDTNNLIHPLTFTNSGSADVFVTSFTAAPAMAYSFLLGGKLNDYGFAIDVDANKNAYITGETFNLKKHATNFPTLKGTGFGPFQTNGLGTNDAFISIISP